MKHKTPLMVFQARHGTNVIETSRSRPMLGEFLEQLAAGMQTAMRGDPDEVIVRLYRPAVE